MDVVAFDEVVGICSSADAAVDVGRRHGAAVYVNHPGEKDSRPYSALIRVAAHADIDSVAALRDVADVGLYKTTTRIIKPLAGEPTGERCVAAFGLVRNPAMTHRECDDHWRDQHGPLALKMHLAMCDYVQVSIDEIVHGLELDGIALCAFENRQDLSTKFFNDDQAKAAIIADVTKFSDAAASPARVVVQQVL